MNPERALLAAEAIGLGRVALRRAATYAGERIVFDRPIGKNQGIQHPLAERWVDLEAGYRACQNLRDRPQLHEVNKCCPQPILYLE